MSDALTFWGSATTTLEVGGLRLLTDPVLDPAGTRFAGAATPLGPRYAYRSLGASAATPEALRGADAVLLSHDQHGDNLDAGGREVARTARLVVTTPAAARRLRAAGFGEVRGLAPWEATALSGGLRVTAVPARHGARGTAWLTGPVTGFWLERPGGGPIYLTGDTRWWGGLGAALARLGPPALAVVHLGAARFGLGPWRNALRFSMDAADAVALARALGPRRLVPVHFEAWSHFTEGREACARAFARAGLSDRVAWPERGQRVAIDG